LSSHCCYCVERKEEEEEKKQKKEARRGGGDYIYIYIFSTNICFVWMTTKEIISGGNCSEISE